MGKKESNAFVLVSIVIAGNEKKRRKCLVNITPPLNKCLLSNSRIDNLLLFLLVILCKIDKTKNL